MPCSWKIVQIKNGLIFHLEITVALMAIPIGVTPLLSSGFLSSTCPMISLQMFKCPFLAALCRGVLPTKSRGFLFSMLLIRSWQIEVLPLAAASWRGVDISLSAWFQLWLPLCTFIRNWTLSMEVKGRAKRILSFLISLIKMCLISAWNFQGKERSLYLIDAVHTCWIFIIYTRWFHDQLTNTQVSVVSGKMQWRSSFTVLLQWACLSSPFIWKSKIYYRWLSVQLYQLIQFQT